MLFTVKCPLTLSEDIFYECLGRIRCAQRQLIGRINTPELKSLTAYAPEAVANYQLATAKA